MVTKSTKPDNIEVDFGSMNQGTVDILVHWNIVKKTVTDSSTYYEYDEERIRVACPRGTEAEITTYLTSQYQRFLIRCGVDDRLTAAENALASLLEGSS